MRWAGEVLTFICALEGSGFTFERSGDDAADPVAVAVLAGDSAHPVELFEGYDILVCGNLKHGVGGRVEDQFAGLHMLLAQVIENHRA